MTSRRIPQKQSTFVGCFFAFGSALGLRDKLNIEWGVPLRKHRTFMDKYKALASAL